MTGIMDTYSSRNVKVGWANHVFEGLAPDDFISFGLATDLIDTEVGADGSISISMSADQTGEFTLSLQQQSRSNDFLAGVMNLQRARNDVVIGSFTVKGDHLVAEVKNAILKTAPPITRGSTATGKTVDWVFFCESIHYQTAADGTTDALGKLADIKAAVENASTLMSKVLGA